MNIIEKAASLLGFEKRSVSEPYWDYIAGLTSGSVVNATTAQSVSAVYACVDAIAGTTASLPLILYRRDGENRNPANDHPLYKVLHDQANEYQTALEFREYMEACRQLQGNAYARVIRGYDGQVRELLPMAPERVSILRDGDGIAGYEYTTRTGTKERLLPGEVFHLRNRAGNDPLIGQSPIAAARGVIQLALAEQDHGNATFSNGTRLTGILKFPQQLKPEQRAALKTSWDAQHAGSSNHGKTAILDQGVDFQTVSMTLEDAEWIEARKLSVIEVCRLFRVPPVIVQSMESANYSNSVELARQFVTLCLRRHLVSWEQAISKQLLTDAGRRVYFPEHSVEGLLRGDSAGRATFYKEGIEAGWLLPSEARRLENLPVIEGIDNGTNQNV